MLLFATFGALADVNITNIPVATGGASTGDKLLGVTNSTHAALVEIKFLNQLAAAYLLGSSNAYLGSFTGNGAGLTNLPGGLATNVPVLVAGTNIWIDVNGLTNTISTLDGIATTNYVGTYYYLQSNPSNFVTATVTNGLATTNYVGTYYYLVSNPSNYVTASVTNGLAPTNWVGQNFWSTNQSVPFDIYTNSSGALSNPLSATALAFQQGYGISRTWIESNNIAITTASIDTNTVITTNGGTFVGQILDNSVSSDSPSANQLVKASWVRSLFSGGTFLYNITNAHPVDATWYIASSTTNSSAQVRTYTGVTNNQYLGTGIMSTQAFTTVYSPMTVNAYLSFNTGGARAVSVKPEFYYVYTNLATNAVSNLLGDYDCGAQPLTAGTNLYTFVVSFPTVSSTNPFYVVRRFKVTSQNANPDVSIHGSGSTPSHISFNSPPATQVASSVYASNVISGGVLPAGTVSSTALTSGYALGNDGSVRIWTNSLPGVSIGGNSATSTMATNLYGYVNPKTFGALMDGIPLTNANITSGAASLTSTSAVFTVSDVGKWVLVWGAGPGGGTNSLMANISSFVSSTNVTLSINAGTTVSGGNAVYGTDDAIPVQNALNYCVSNGMVLDFPSGICVIKGVINNTVKKSILSIPNMGLAEGGAITPTFSPSITIQGRGYGGMGGGSYKCGWSGTWLVCVNATNVVSDSSFFQAGDDSSGSLAANMIKVVWKDIGIRLPGNPQMSALLMGYTSANALSGVAVDSGYGSYDPSAPQPTKSTSIAVEMSYSGMNGVGENTLQSVDITGFYRGLSASEHTHWQSGFIQLCSIGVYFPNAWHATLFDHIGFQRCATCFSTSGNGVSTSMMNALCVDIEKTTGGGKWYDTTYDVTDPSSVLHGFLFHTTTTAATPVPFTYSGATNLAKIPMFGGRFPSASLATNAPTDNFVLSATGSDGKWVAQSGSQTPWTSDINGSGYSLTNVNQITATNGLFITGTLYSPASMANGAIQLYNSNGVLFAICKDTGGTITTNKLAP